MEERGGVNMGSFFSSVYDDTKEYKKAYMYVYSIEYKKMIDSPYIRAMKKITPIYLPQM